MTSGGFGSVWDNGMTDSLLVMLFVVWMTVVVVVVVVVAF